MPHYFAALRHPLLPHAHVAWFNLGDCLELLGDWARAAKAFNRSLGAGTDVTDARLAELHRRLGELQAKLGGWDEAVAHLGASLELSRAAVGHQQAAALAEEPRALRNLGAALLNRGSECTCALARLRRSSSRSAVSV